MMLHHLSANDRYERNRHLSAQQQRMAAAATKRAATAAEQQKREEQMQQKQQQEKEEEEELQQQQQPTANGDLGNATCVIATTAAAAPTHPTDDDIFTSTTFPWKERCHPQEVSYQEVTHKVSLKRYCYLPPPHPFHCYINLLLLMLSWFAFSRWKETLKK